MINPKRLAIILLGTTIAMVMVVLGLWQASTYRTQGADATRERASQAPVPLPSGAQGNQAAELYGRRVTITGEYLPQSHYVGTKDPLRVVTAFRTTEGTVIAVVRGQVPAEGTPPPPPRGKVTQSGLLMPSEKDPVGTPDAGLPTPLRAQVKLEELAQTWPEPLLNGFVTLDAADATAQSLTPASVKLPEGEGSQRNAGYALQWWVFAVFAMVMTVIWARSVPSRLAK